MDRLAWKLALRYFRAKQLVTKQAAEGAAVFANGLAGGKYKQLVDVMQT